MNRRKARFSRPVKVTQARVEVPSDEEDQCGREEQPPPPPQPLGKFRINPADAPITPPLTPPRHGASSGKAAPTSAPATKAPPSPQERGAHHVLTTLRQAPPPPSPSAPPPLLPSKQGGEHENTGRLLLTVPPPPPPSVPPPPPPLSRQLNRLPPAPLTLYGPPTLDHITRSHPLSLEDRQQQRTATSDSPLAADARPLYRPPAVDNSGRLPSPRDRNSREQSPPHEEQRGVPSILPFNFQVDFSVPPPPISQTPNVPSHLVTLVGRVAHDYFQQKLRQNYPTSNVSRPCVPHSQEQSQIVPVKYQVSQLNAVPQFHLTPSSVSQPHMPAHNFPSLREPQANSSHNLVHPHHLTQPNVRMQELPSHMPQHMSTYHSSHSHMPTYNRYPSVIPLPHGPLTDVPPTHGKSPHIAQQGRSYSRNRSENSAAHHRPLNNESQLYMAGSYKNSSSEHSFTNREGARRTSRDTPRDEYNSWFRRDDQQHTNISNNLPNLLNLWVPPPFQTPRSRPPPLPPPLQPPPQQQIEPGNQIPVSHLLGMPTPPPDQHDKTLSPGSENSHSYQNYQGHQQYWNQQKTSSSLAVPECQGYHTDTRRSYDTTDSRWGQDVPHRLASYRAPTPRQPRMDHSAVQMDDHYRSSYHGHGAYVRGRSNRRGRTTTFRQLVQVAPNNENEDLTAHRQYNTNATGDIHEEGQDVCALSSAIKLVRRGLGGAAAATTGTTAPAGVSPTGMPALPAPPVLPALPAPHTLPALMAAPWSSTAAASASQAFQEDNEDDSVEKRLCLDSRKKDESVMNASSQLAVPFTNPAIQNDDPTPAMTLQYNDFIKMYMKGSFGDALHVHQGQSSLSVTPKDPQTCLLPSTGQSMDVAAREIHYGLLPSGDNLLLPDLFPSYLSLQTAIEHQNTLLKNFWLSVYQQEGLKLGSLPMLQPQNSDQLGIHLDQQMMVNKYVNALVELDHQILFRGSLGSATSLAVLPPALSIHSSKAEGSALTQYTQSGTLGTSPSHQSNLLRSALQDSSAQTPALPACSSSACCNNTIHKTTKQEQQQKELEQLKLFQTQQLQRKNEVETLRQRNEETLAQINEVQLRWLNEVTVRHMNEQLQLQQQRKFEEDKMKQLNEELQKQSIQAYIEQQEQHLQHTQQKKIQKETEKVYALKDMHRVPFIQQQKNEDGMIRENEHLKTKPHQDVNLQLNSTKAKKGRKRKSDQLEQESTMKRAMNHEGHRESQISSADGMQKSVIVHGKGHVNQMSEFTYQQQFQSAHSGIMKDSQRQLSKQGKQEQQPKMPQLTQLLMQGQSANGSRQMAKAQKRKVAPRAPELAAEQIIMEQRQRKQSEMPCNIQNKKALHVPNLFTDVHVQQKISEYIKQEPISSPTDGTVIKQEHQLNMWPGNTLNMAKVAKDLQQAQLGVDIQRKPLSFSHHDAAAATQLTVGSQGLDLSSQRHVQKLLCDNITIKTEEPTEEICDQTTNQQTQETFDLLEELDEIKLDTLQQQNTDQQQNLLELPSFGSYLNVDGMEEVDVEEADLNAAYHAVVSLQQSEIPDVPATPPSHTARSSENCPSPMNRSIVSNLSRTTKQLDEVCCSPKVVKKVPVIQMPQINPSPISVQTKTDADIRGAKVQQKPSRRSKKSFEKEEATVPTSDVTHKSKSDSTRELICALNETSHGHTVSLYQSAYKHTNTLSETRTDAAKGTVSGSANTRNTVLTAATTRNSRAAVRKATHESTPSANLTESDKVVSSFEAQAILQGVSSNSTYATAFETNDIASSSLHLARTRKGVKRKYSTRQSKK